MKTDRLQDALGMIRDDYVLDAHSGKKTNSAVWRRWGTLAACLCLAAVCAFGVPRLLHRETAPALHPDGTPVVEPGADPVKPDPDPAKPGTNPDLPEPLYDWPVIYNEVDSMPDAEAHYVSIAGRALTETELDALLPIRGGDLLKLERSYAYFGGYGLDEPGGHIYPEDAKLDSVELDYVDPNRGCSVRIGMWPAGQTSLFSWASQFNPKEYQATNFGSDQETLFLTLFQCEDTVWTYLTCGDVSYYVSADKAFRDGIGDNFYHVVLGLLRSDNNSPDLSILVPNP